MRTKVLLSMIVLTLVLASVAITIPRAFAQEAAPAETPPGSITFVGKNMVATANGTFHQWKFTKAEFNPAEPAGGEVAIEVDVASIDTAIVKRDDHLRTADFFDVAQYPTATLRIYDIAASEGSKYTAKLDWSMHGVEKTYDNFTFEVTNQSPVRVNGTFTINRMDFNIGEEHKNLSPMSIENEIPITFEATLPEGA